MLLNSSLCGQMTQESCRLRLMCAAVFTWTPGWWSQKVFFTPLSAVIKLLYDVAYSLYAWIFTNAPTDSSFVCGAPVSSVQESRELCWTTHQQSFRERGWFKMEELIVNHSLPWSCTWRSKATCSVALKSVSSCQTSRPLVCCKALLWESQL